MHQKKPETASEMLGSLHEFILDDEADFAAMPAEKVMAYLKKNDLDTDNVFSAVQSALADAQGKLALAKAREKRLRIERSFPDAGRPWGQQLRETVLNKIRDLAGTDRAMVYARKFEESPDEDLKSLVQDFEFLDQLDLNDE